MITKHKSMTLVVSIDFESFAQECVNILSLCPVKYVILPCGDIDTNKLTYRYIKSAKHLMSYNINSQCDIDYWGHWYLRPDINDIRAVEVERRRHCHGLNYVNA